MFLSWLNDRINFELKRTSDLTVAFFAAVIDKSEMILTYANAGQPLPFLLRNGIPAELPGVDAALGTAGNAAYSEQKVKLGAGDVLVAFTDGLLCGGTGSAGAGSMHQALRSTAYGDDYHKRLLEAVLGCSGTSAFTDDVTLVTAMLA
jgi:serine phosphatase RsbU (regulator of sigma subunit)